MQLLKFYGRTMEAALARVRRELGEDALIVETRSFGPESATARLHPGAEFEVTAALEPADLVAPADSGDWVKRAAATRKASGRGAARRAEPAGAAGPRTHAESGAASEAAATSARPPSALLEDMGRVKAQIRDLLEQTGGEPADVRTHSDLADYRHLIAQGVDPAILAHSFRRWLDWRLGPDRDTTFPPLFDPDAVMKGKGMREWVWNEWRHQLSFYRRIKSPKQTAGGPEILGVVGGPGVGKSTILAKLASKSRLEDKKKVAIINLDTQRLGAADQWRRYAKLMDISLIEAATQEDAKKCINLIDRFDWVGIDTPGAMAPRSDAAKAYGSFLATCRQMRTAVVLDACSRDRANRMNIEKTRRYRPEQLIFAKVDEAPERGGMLNLTLEEPWIVEVASTGRGIPEDLEPVTPAALWHWVFSAEGDQASDRPDLQGAVS